MLTRPPVMTLCFRSHRFIRREGLRKDWVKAEEGKRSPSNPLLAFGFIRRLSTPPGGKSPGPPLPSGQEKLIANTTSQPLPPVGRRNKQIIRLDPAEYEATAVGMKRPPLIERLEESTPSVFRFRKEDEPPGYWVDRLVKLQTDIDLRPSAIKRLWDSINYENELKSQIFNQKRVTVLGRDLGAAHFIVARKGKVKFMGDEHWISNYRNDMEPGVDERDLPVLSHSLCSLPVKYDPNFRVEALDASGMVLHYEGLANLSGLNYIKWLSLRNNPVLNDWCLDRIYCNLGETLEYLDISGCKGISISGLTGLWRIKNLKTLVVENLTHIKDLEILCAALEDQLPELVCVGVDFESKLKEMKANAAALEQKVKEEAAALEANTVDIIPRTSKECSERTPT